MSENKKKYAYWMKPSMVEEITEMLDTANATSKSDFVCQAVQFYIGYLHQKKCIDYHECPYILSVCLHLKMQDF
jgi:metal-responsive CopG/Arc/MetJ family transcriptional regulator